MADIVVCVPKGVWQDWLEEGNLPGEPWDPDEDDYHWFSRGPVPHIDPGERVYVVAHGRLRGYAPLVRIDHRAQWATPPKRGMRGSLTPASPTLSKRTHDR